MPKPLPRGQRRAIAIRKRREAHQLRVLIAVRRATREPKETK